MANGRGNRAALLSLGPHRAPAATAVAAAVLTAALVFTPLGFTYRSPELRVSLETAQAVIAALVALLLYGRSRRSGLWGDLLAAYALFLFAATSLFFVLLPLLADPSPGGNLDRFDTWAPLFARMVGAGALAWAALAPVRWVHLRRGPLAMVDTVGATVVSLALLVWATLDWLPPVVEHLPASGSARPDLDAPGGLLAAQLLLLTLFALAAAGFARRARHEPNPLNTALACGCVLAAFSRLNFFLYPSIYTDVVHVGDVLRLLFFLVLLAGAGAEIAGYWRVEAEAAAGRERQRLARELHDGLAQELAFIRSHTAALAKGASHPGVTPLVAEAAERAIIESRRVVDALRANGLASLEQVLADAAGDVVRPTGSRVAVEVEVDSQVVLPPAAQAGLRQLVRQATATAVRLRAASKVSVRLEVCQGRAVLTVEDDGVRTAPAGPGRTAQRDLERASEGLGGTLRATSLDRGGTRLEIVLPWRPGRRPGAAEAP